MLVMSWEVGAFSEKDFKWGPFKGKCNPNINEGKCTINGDTGGNNLIFYWNNIKDRTCGSCGAIQEKP